jgi:hypothetical protein
MNTDLAKQMQLMMLIAFSISGIIIFGVAHVFLQRAHLVLSSSWSFLPSHV